MSEPEQVTPPPSGRPFSWGRVGQGVFFVLLAAGTFAAVWLAPWPRPAAKPPPPSLPMKEHLEALKKAAERKAAADRAERERGAGDKP